eukprot:TRINITY_DN9802_c0_g1_i3.p1 TRINITY_DN9802_c0_g1~~TRINITY_DN9802_c0_g1_i3.p1  ORF type:complete len:400 (+),score=169.87 TRINITY_DN9802_c0_g1_i3:73-1272(+)
MKRTTVVLSVIGVSLLVTLMMGYHIIHPSETHKQTLERHGLTVHGAEHHKKMLEAKEREVVVLSKETKPEAKPEAKPVAKPVAKQQQNVQQKSQGEEVQEQQHEQEAKEDPVKRQAGAPRMWNGMEMPASGTWDFHGLPIDLDKPVAQKIVDKALRADYSWKDVQKKPLPEQYTAKDPAFRYPDDNDALFATVSHVPHIIYFPRIMTDEEADHVVTQASPRMHRSQVALTKEDQNAKKSSTQEVRTSKSTWVSLDGKLADLDKRLRAVVGTDWHEPMNVLHYEHMQHYDAHHDYFDPKRYGQQSSNRMGTFFLYLNDTEAGGSTTVPRANNGRFPANYKEASCNQGLQIFPRKGSAFLLYDMRPDRTFDEFSLHGGCDVEKGTKWGGVVWFRINTPDSK